VQADVQSKIKRLLERLKECEGLLGEPDIFSDQKRYKALTQEHSYLQGVKTLYEEILSLEKQLEENRLLLKKEQDEAFIEMLREDNETLEKKRESSEKALEDLLIPPDPNDHKETIVELRAGTGGDEAALFVGDMVRMYQFYAGKMGWKVETLSFAESEVGGFKEYVMVLSGPNVYRFMQHEAGVHRVQRVPDTETQGRVHTSAITVAVLMEPDAEDEVVIDEKELRVDTYRSSGAGGQHVNTTDSAVRLTHLPTGIVVYCQQERSQHKNKEKAMRLLKAKISEVQREKKAAAIASERQGQIGTGDRSERIRTYNYPQNRVTEHRLGLTLYNLSQVMEGELHAIPSALVAFFKQKQLADEAH
jgi:peptide chain release factor 1